jgi:hypothetical protein
LITFKYHVEVIVDLGGKLAGPSSGSSQSQQPTRMVSSASVRGTYGIDLNLLANWNGAIIDTDHIRREKGVISVSFEVVVGTTDSSRSRGKAIVRPTPMVQAPSPEEPSHEAEAYGYDWQNTYDGQTENHEEYSSSGFQHSQPGLYPLVTSPQTAHYDFETQETQVPIYVPPPEVADEGNLTDKERARRAEQRLLPSQPSPQPPGTEPGPSQLGACTSTSPRSQPGPDCEAGQEPSAPALGNLESESSQHRTDDKQELERQRLMTEASAPPDVPEDYNGGEASVPILNWTRPSPSWSHEPSAPTLDEEHDENGDHYHGTMESSNAPGSLEPLPRYER